MIKQLILWMALFTISTGVYAQESKESEVPKKFNTYNYRRAMECLDESEYDKAKEFLETEVKENPKNGYAFNILSLLNFINEENDEALETINKAITLIPKKDAEKLAECYDIRAHIYLQMEDSLKALDDLAFAFKLNPKDTEFIQNRAQIYYEMGQYDLSDAEYQKCIDLDPKDVMGYMGIGRNANAQERWEDAIKMFDKVEKIADEDYNKHFDFRADSYMGLKKWEKAAEALITFVEKDEEYSAVLYAIEDHQEMIPVLKTKLKLKTMQNPTNPYWPYFLAKVEQKTGDYKAAIEHYYKSDEIDETNGSIGNIIDCCEEMGDYQRALDIINKTLEEDSTLTDLIDTKINVLENLGRYDEAVELAETLFEEGDGDSYNFVNFITRGYAYYKAGNLKGALDDFILAIADYDKSATRPWPRWTMPKWWNWKRKANHTDAFPMHISHWVRRKKPWNTWRKDWKRKKTKAISMTLPASTHSWVRRKKPSTTSRKVSRKDGGRSYTWITTATSTTSATPSDTRISWQNTRPCSKRNSLRTMSLASPPTPGLARCPRCPSPRKVVCAK